MSTQQDTRHLSPAGQELLRKKAVAMVSTGMKQVQVSRLLGVSEWSISQWLKQVRQKGEKSLNSRKRGTRTPNILLKPIHIMDERGYTTANLEEVSHSSGFAHTDRLFETMGDDTQGTCCQGV